MLALDGAVLAVERGEGAGLRLGPLERLADRVDVLPEVLGQRVVRAVALAGLRVEEPAHRDGALAGVLDDGVLILVDNLAREQRRAEVVRRHAESGGDGLEGCLRRVAVFCEPRGERLWGHFRCWVVGLEGSGCCGGSAGRFWIDRKVPVLLVALRGMEIHRQTLYQTTTDAIEEI